MDSRIGVEKPDARCGPSCGGRVVAVVAAVAGLACAVAYSDLVSAVAFATFAPRSRAGADVAPRPACTDLDALGRGTWNNATEEWEPRACARQQLTRALLERCLAGARIGFYGDSTLRRVVAELSRLVEVNFKLASWAPAPHYVGGGNFGNGTRAAMFWTPSAYHQKPANVGTFASDDVAIISIGVWDMGQYYRGVNAWHESMKSILMRALERRPGKPVFVVNLHKMYATRCSLVRDTEEGRKNLELCRQCNKEEEVTAFRAALVAAYGCVRATPRGANLHLIDPYGLTDSPFAGNRSDGVHFDPVVTRMELEFMMAAVCQGLRHPSAKAENVSCPTGINFEEGKHLSCKGTL